MRSRLVAGAEAAAREEWAHHARPIPLEMTIDKYAVLDHEFRTGDSVIADDLVGGKREAEGTITKITRFPNHNEDSIRVAPKDGYHPYWRHASSLRKL
jgi:hypothetical protein